MIFGIIIASYLGSGIVFRIVFQLATRRISRRLHDVSVDVMMRLATGGAAIVTRKIAIGITLLYAWTLWPAILVAYINDLRTEKLEKK
jgi:hypothetical protein